MSGDPHACVQPVARPALLIALAPSYAADSVVQAVEGNGARTTRPFVVADDWEVQWIAKGDPFQVYLHDGEGTLIGLTASQPGAGSGSSYVRKGGRYYLQVNALGTWTLRIVQIAPQASHKK